MLETGGGPAVYGDWLHAGPDAPTVLVYGHHDVQPVDPLEEWTSPAVRAGHRRRRVPGPGRHRRQGPDPLPDRGGPGPARPSDGRLPVNLKLLVEGEEEVGSPHFEALLVAEADSPGLRRGRGVRHRHDRPRRAVDDASACAAWSPSTSPCGPRRSTCTAACGAGRSPTRPWSRLAWSPSLHDDDGPGHPARLLRPGPRPHPGRAGLARRPALRRGGVPGRGRRRRLPGGRGGLQPPRADRGAARPPRSSGCTAATAVRASRPSCRPRPASRWRSGWCPTSDPTRSTPPSGPGWPSGCRPGSR